MSDNHYDNANVYVHDESHFIFTDAAWIIPTISGSVSTVSSMLIISVILRSSNESRFNSYHLIMLFMSFWDTIASTAIALTTIPMPSDVYDVYPFQGKALGNVGTCVAQGVFIQLGTFFTLASNCCLNIYYLCTIRCGMSEERMKKGVIPKMLILCALFAMPVPLQSLMMHHTINPNPLFSYCGRCSYPIFCTSNNNSVDGGGPGGDKSTMSDSDEANESSLECISVNTHEGWLKIIVLVLVGTTFFIMLFSLVLVVVTVFETEIALRRARRIRRRSMRRSRINTRSRSRSRLSTDEYEETRVLLLQACMYIAAFVLPYTWILVLFIKTGGTSTSGNGNDSYDPGRYFIIARSIFRPLQGFFNAIIFIYQKAYSLRRADRSLPFMGAIVQVIKSPQTVPGMLISGIVVQEENDENDDDGHEHGAAVPGYTSNNFMRRRGLGGSGIESLGAEATLGQDSNSNNNSNDDMNSDDSNVAQSDLEAHSSSSHDALDQEDFFSLAYQSYPSVDESSEGLTSNCFSGTTSRLATVQEEENEECPD